MTNSPVSRLGLYRKRGEVTSPKFLERELEPGRTETVAIAPPTELARRTGWAPQTTSPIIES